jgi:hypothetical protein
VLHVALLLRSLNRALHTFGALAGLITSYSLSSGLPSQPDHLNSGLPNFERHLILPPSSPTDPASPTFAQARAALASWVSEASRGTESIKEWSQMCTTEIPEWDDIEVALEESDDESELDRL